MLGRPCYPNQEGVKMKGKYSKKRKRPKDLRRSTATALSKSRSSSSTPIHPSANGVGHHSTNRCRKCQGFLVLQQPDPSQPIEIRCVNCGWQPQWGTKIVTETDEIRSIRRLTAKFSSESVWRGTPAMRTRTFSEGLQMKAKKDRQMKKFK